MRRRVICLAIAGTLGVGAGCSSDAAPAATVAPAVTGATDPAPPSLPRVDLIGEAITALEAQLGGPQQYFEINATPNLVNLFVALNDRTIAQPWVYLDGELSSKEGQGAQGNAFAAAALTFDPATILAATTEELDGPDIDVLVIEADAMGRAHYTLVVTSGQGAQLLVTVDATGAVLAVDPN